MNHSSRPGANRDLIPLFLKLGATAFGGPAAHISLMEDEVVRRRGWLTREAFLDMVGAVNLLPGPSSTELAIYIGYARAGWAGLVLAGTCFILPAMLIVGALAALYVRFGAVPQVAGLLYGVKPIVVAVVLQALWGLGAASLTSPRKWIIGLAAIAATLSGISQLAVLGLAGAAMVLISAAASRRRGAAAPAVLLFAKSLAPGVAPFGLGSLFAVFFKIGAVLFGSGYVLLAFLHADLVQHLRWLSERQLLDAVAVGQVTPGPVFTTATFIGYLLGGVPGALVATAGIFLPSFLLVAASGPLLPRLRRSPVARAFLDGVIVASLALMAVVSWRLGRAALIDLLTVALFGIGAVLLLRFRVSSTWLIAGGALVGLIRKLAVM